MEGLTPLHRRVAGIDVHRMLHMVTVLVKQPDGSISRSSQEFGGFKRDCRALAAWLLELGVELVVMESTGIYWKSVHAHLERAGINAWVVNAHFIKHVPGRKTDMSDSEWLAVLARFGLVRSSFIRPQDLRELQSTRLNKADPWVYLKDVLTRLPTQLNSRLEELLPHRWKPAS